MKLRYIIGALAATLLFAGCQRESMVGPFSDFQLDKTFVSIDMAGGSQTITITSAGDWEITKHFDTGKKDDNKQKIYDYMPAWVSVDKLAGSNGATVTITAAATESGREAELQFKSGSKLQHLIVRQGSLEAEKATCKEVLEGPDGKSFMVTGKVTSIANTTYGNWYLSDGTGEVYVYGTLDKDGKEKNFTSLGIEVGDVVTVKGPKTTYNGTVELVNVTVLKIEKALLTILSEEPTLEQPGGAFDVKVAYKGSGAFVSIEENAKEWLSLNDAKYTPGVPTIFEKNPADTVVFSFNALPNDGDELRKGKIVFSSSKLDGESTISTQMDYTVSVKGNSKKGTLAEPYTVSEIAALILGGETPAQNVYIKGKISSILYSFSAQYGTATFWISDDGTAYGVSEDKKKTTEPTKDFECYGVYWFDNKPWTEGEGQIEVGDEVIVCGKTTLYGGIAETSNKNAWVYSVNGATVSANGLGNANAPFNVAGARAFIDNMVAAKAAAKEAGNPEPTFPDVCVAGKVSAILYAFSANYGTGTFWISDDGVAYGISEDKKKTTEPTKDFECYAVYWNNNTPWAEGDGQPTVGDKVVVKGQLTIYGNTYETANKLAWVESWTPAN